MKSEKIIIKITSKKIEKFVFDIIKDFKLSSDKSDYKINEKTFELYNTNQYNFTDIRNEIFREKIDYEELWL
mgnify:CR=1 FL=1